jgi:hypothetical protein
MPPETIGAPLWLSGDRSDCPECGRLISWLDIVSSALKNVHDRTMIARVILGDQKYVNTEAPNAIAGLTCSKCNAPIRNVRSFKCHNWAYARQAMLDVLEQIDAQRGGR